MLTDGIANAYRQGCQRMQGVSGVTALLTSEDLSVAAALLVGDHCCKLVGKSRARP